MTTVARWVALAALCMAAAAGCRFDPVMYGGPSADARPGQDDAGSREGGGRAGDQGDATTGPRPDAPGTPSAAREAGAPSSAAPEAGVPDAPTGCVPSAEQCNGLDEDCDGSIDEGCPVAGALLITEGGRTSSPAFGSLTLDQNRPLTYRCPPGQAIVAFTGNSGYAIDSLGVTCARLQVQEDRGAMPFRYPLAVEPGQSFEPMGGTSGGVNNATRCPPGFVVSGISAWPSRPAAVCPVNYCAAGVSTACPTNFGLEIHCSRYLIEGLPGRFRFVAMDELPFRTAARNEVDLTDFGFPNSKVEYSCPAGQVVVDANASIGPWPFDCAKTTVNGLRVACAAPAVRLR